MIVPTEEKAWIQSNNYRTCLEGKGHLAAEVNSNKGILEENASPPKKKKKKSRGGKNKNTRKREASTMGEKVTMVLARIFKHVSESVPPANTGNFSKLLRR